MSVTTTNGLHHLGATRSRRGPDHLLQTPDTFVWAPLPSLTGATACVHTSPRLGAGFAQYSIQFEAGGSWQSDASHSRLIFVLQGSASRESVSDAAPLRSGEYCYIPAGQALQLSAGSQSRVVVIEKPHQPLSGSPLPQPLHGVESALSSTALSGDESIQVRSLLPSDSCYDLAVNTMTYEPGARLGMVEVHAMEHGLLMLEGEGIYRLGDSWYPITAGDFIWMAPYCPQWFGALGKEPAKYLIYKDWNRAPLYPATPL